MVGSTFFPKFIHKLLGKAICVLTLILYVVSNLLNGCGIVSRSLLLFWLLLFIVGGGFSCPGSCLGKPSGEMQVSCRLDTENCCKKHMFTFISVFCVSVCIYVWLCVCVCDL